MDASVVVDTELRLINGEVESSDPVLIYPQHVGASLNGRGCSEGEKDQCAGTLSFLLTAPLRSAHSEANGYVPDSCSRARRVPIECCPDALHLQPLPAGETVVGVPRDEHA